MSDNNASSNQIPAPPPARGGAGPLATLAFILALGAVAGTAYIYYLYDQEKQAQRSASEELNERIEAALVEVADQQEADLQSLAERLEAQQTRAEELQATTLTQGSDVQVLQDQLQTAQSDLRTLQGELQTLKGSIETQRGTQESQRSDIRTLQTDIRTLQDEIQALDGNLQSLNVALNAVEEAGSVRDQTLQALQSEDGALARRIDSLSGGLDDLGQALAALAENGELRQTELEALQATTDQLQGSLQTLGDTLETRIDDQEAALGQINGRIDNLQLGQRGLVSTLEAIKTMVAQGGDINAFPLSEVEYLLRMASHKLEFQQDVAGALEALEVAADRLDTVDENAFLGVKRMLQENIAALQALDLPDYDNLSQEIAGLAGQIDELPLKTEIRAANLGTDDTPETPEQGGDAPWWNRLGTEVWNEFSKSIVVRNAGTNGPPLIGVEEEYFLLQNLRLELDAMRLALLRRDATGYQSSIEKARGWVEAYFDNDAPQVQDFLDQLQSLQTVQLNPYVPDISDTLAAFNDVMARREPIRSVANPSVSAQTVDEASTSQETQ